MRILLIRPPQVRWSNEARRCGTPTGLLSIAATLRKRWDVHFVDAVAEGYETQEEIAPDLYRFGLTDPQLAEIVARYDPDVVGLTNSFTVFWGVTYSTAKLVRRVKPNAVIVLGGHHPAGVPEEIFGLDLDRAIDFIVLGEAEHATTRLLEKLASGRDDFENVPSLAFRRGDRTVTTEPDRNRPHLDDLPDPAWDLMDSRLYDHRMSHFGMPRGDSFLDVLFSRGCPIGCAFCTTTDYWGRTARVFSRARIEGQLAVARELGWAEIVLEDDNILTLPQAAQIDILESMGEARLPWNLDGGLYYPAVTKEFIDRLAANHCYRVFMPVENPDVEIMHHCHKYASIQRASDRDRSLYQVASWLNDAGIEFYSAIMIGFPGETLDSIRKALRFARFIKDELGALGCALHWVHPYPFSRLYHEAYELVDPRRKWQDRPEYFSFVKPVFPIEGISLDDASWMVDDAFFAIHGSRSRNTSYESWRAETVPAIR